MRTKYFSSWSKSQRNMRDRISNIKRVIATKVLLALAYLILPVFVAGAQDAVETRGCLHLLSALNGEPVPQTFSGWMSDSGLNATGKDSKAFTLFYCPSVRKLKENETKANEIVNSYFKGAFDADYSYNSGRTGKGAIIATTLVGTPVLGLISFLAYSSGTVTNKDSSIPGYLPKNNNAFSAGYRSEASKIRKRDNWGCYIIASVTWLCIAAFLVR